MTTWSTHIILRNRGDLAKLDGLELDIMPRIARYFDQVVRVPAFLNDEQISAVRARGFTVEPLVDFDEAGTARQREVGSGHRYTAPRDILREGSRTIDGYLTVSEVEAAAAALALVHGDLVDHIVLPETSWEGRTVSALRVRADVPGSSSTRPALVMLGGVHAREWVPVDAMIKLLEDVIAAYRAATGVSFGSSSFTSAQVRAVLEQTELVVVPCVNPDGRHHSQTMYPLWRKNRNPSGAVDVNRNFDFLWSSGIGTSASSSSNTYKGVTAFSEPESRNVRWLVDQLPHLRYFVDVHSAGELILYSWGDDDNQVRERVQHFANPAFDGQRGTPGDTVYAEFIPTLDQNTAIGLARRMRNAISAVRGHTYNVEQASGLYPTSGTTDDWAHARHRLFSSHPKVFAYTVESAQTVIPPHTEGLQVMDEICAAMLELAYAATTRVYIRDNAADVGTSTTSGTFWNSPDVWVRYANDGGETHQPPIEGHQHYVSVRAHNGGIAPARHLVVRVYLTNFAGTEFRHPQDWIPREPGGGGLGAPGTYFIGEADIATLAAGSSTIVTVPWTASLVPDVGTWHPCILAEVSPEDGLPPDGKHAWDHPNLAQKNLTIIEAPAGDRVRFAFRLGGLHTKALAGALEVRTPRALLDAISLTGLPNHIFDIPTKRPGALANFWNGDLKTKFLHPVQMVIRWPSLFGRGEVEANLPVGASFHMTKFGSAFGKPLLDTSTNMGWKAIGSSSMSIVGTNATVQLRPDAQLAPREMHLDVQVPKTAAPGQMYEVGVMQRDQRERVVGGVTLVVRVA